MTKFEKDISNRFGRSERLSSKKTIESLFTTGRSFSHYPYLVKYIGLEDSTDSLHQILVSVSKRNFKRAVDRNRIKRQIREVYRLNKHIIADLANKYAIAYIYTFKKVLPYKELEIKLIECLYRLQSELTEKNED
jgi:ribonuclease P protein component